VGHSILCSAASQAQDWHGRSQKASNPIAKQALSIVGDQHQGSAMFRSKNGVLIVLSTWYKVDGVVVLGDKMGFPSQNMI
jgi:hypothetical protein